MCEASDIVLFGAAIKDQGGQNHINEQWQSYWVDLFNANDYECLDFFREKVWNNDAVEWWYKQNTFLFIKRNSSYKNLETFKSTREPLLDIVHPLNYKIKVDRYNKQKKINKQQNDIISKIKEEKRKVVDIKAFTNPMKKYRAYKNLIKEISERT